MCLKYRTMNLCKRILLKCADTSAFMFNGVLGKQLNNYRQFEGIIEYRVVFKWNAQCTKKYL